MMLSLVILTCNFTLGANDPLLRTYTLQAETGNDWASMELRLLLVQRDGLAAVRADNVSV